MDKRRQYVPIDALIAFGGFGSKLGAKWGAEGLGCWMLFLAACKRSSPQGQFTYVSEDDAWANLGARARQFTVDEFFKFTGRHHKTRKSCHGRITYVDCTVWGKWNTRWQPPPRPVIDPLSTDQRTADELPTSSQRASDDGETPRSEQQSSVSDSEVEGRSSESEAEGSAYYGLPFENELLTARLLKVCGSSVDEGTAGVFRSYSQKVSPVSLARVIETTRRKPERERARYANGALQSEIRERSA